MIRYTILPTVAALLCSNLSFASSFTEGNLVLSRVGDGITPLNNTSGPLTILELSPTGQTVQSLHLSTTATQGLQLCGTAISEGALSLSADHSSLSITGYLPPTSGTGALSSRTSDQSNRAFVDIHSDGSISDPTLIQSFSRESVRSSVETPNGTYIAGTNTSNGGLFYQASVTTPINESINPRVLNVFNHQLFYSTASGTRGIYRFSDLPTALSTPELVINMGTSASPYDFVFNPSGDVAYATNGSLIQRYTYNGTSWSLASSSSTLGANLTGLEVIFQNDQDSIFAVNSSSLYTLSFSNSSFTHPSTLATAGSNFAFRGLSLAPVPEPSTLALLLASPLLFLRRRKP